MAQFSLKPKDEHDFGVLCGLQAHTVGRHRLLMGNARLGPSLGLVCSSCSEASERPSGVVSRAE